MDLIWLNACHNIKIPDEVAKNWLKKIQEKTSEPSRHYHNWNVILLNKKKYLENLNSCVIIAIFFQYYEFDVKKNCVEENCKALDEFFQEAGFTDQTSIKRIKKLIGDVSILEDVEGYNEDAYIFRDLDLLILGSPPEEYQNYCNLLRKEYTHMDDKNFKAMRLKILQTFLIIPTIYANEEFQKNYGSIARSNIISEIEKLKN